MAGDHPLHHEPDTARTLPSGAASWLVLAALLCGVLRLGVVLRDAALAPPIADDAALMAHILGDDVGMIAAIEQHSPERIAIAWRRPPDALARSRAQWLWLGIPGLRPDPLAEYAVAFTTDPPRGTVLHTTSNLRLERRVRIRLR